MTLDATVTSWCPVLPHSTVFPSVVATATLASFRFWLLLFVFRRGRRRLLLLVSLVKTCDRCSLAEGSLCLLLSLVLVNRLLDSRGILALQIEDFLSEMCIFAASMNRNTVRSSLDTASRLAISPSFVRRCQKSPVALPWSLCTWKKSTRLLKMGYKDLNSASNMSMQPAGPKIVVPGHI